MNQWAFKHSVRNLPLNDSMKALSHLRRNEPPEAEVQRKNIIAAVVRSVASIARRHDIVVTHGNGPQIGLLALQAAAFKEVKPILSNLLGAEA